MAFAKLILIRRFFAFFIFFLTNSFVFGEVEQKFQSRLDSLEFILKNTNLQDTIRLETLQSLIKECINLDIKRGERYYVELENLLKKISHPIHLASAYNTMGLFNWAKSDFKQALEFFLKSASINDSIKNEIGLLRNYGNIGLVHQTNENYEKAIEYTQKALKLAEKLKLKRELSLAYGNLGIIYHEIKNYKEALVHHNKALKLTEEMNDVRGIIRNLSNIAVVYSSTKKFKEAIETYTKALDYAFKEGDKRSIVLLEGNLGVTYYNMATDTTLQISNNEKNNLLQNSVKYLFQAIELAKEMNFVDALYEYYSSLALTYEALDDYKNALNYMRLFYAVKDSLFNIENNKTLNDLQSKFEKQIVEKENLLLRKENQLKEITIYASVAFSAIVLSGIILLYRSNKLTKKLNSELEEKNRKISDAKIELERLLEIISTKNIELESTNNELIQTNATKDKLFSIISHDLRNPLQAILLSAELLHNFRERMTEAEQLDKINKIMESSKNLSNLLEELLQWSRTQMKKMEVNPIDFSLHSLVNVVTKLLTQQAEQKSIKIQNELSESLFVFADMNMVNVIFRNLISNAIKFTHPNGIVRIYENTNNDKDFCYISVEDNGVGIPPDKLQKLFKITESFTTRGTNNESGTGLGLILVYEFVKLNNGSISVNSEVGKGTTFTIKLPRTKLN